MAKGHARGLWGFVVTLLRGLNLVRIIALNVIFFGVIALIVVAYEHRPPAIDGDTVLVIEPHGRLVERYTVAPWERALEPVTGAQAGEVRVRDLVRGIDAAARDDRIRRLVLLPSHLSAGGFAALAEVGAAIDRFRASGKPVTVWASSLDRNQYYLAVHADSIWLDPVGSVLITGLSSYRLYFKDLLDRLGIGAHLFRVGQFKSAAEPFILDHASAAAKEADRYWLSGLWNEWLDEVSMRRSMNRAKLGETLDQWPQLLGGTGGDDAELALRTHLVDKLVTQAEMVAAMRTAGVPAAADGRGFRHVTLADYLNRGVGGPRDGRNADVAIVVAQGAITGVDSAATGMDAFRVAAVLDELRGNDDVKAVVLRVDSPGGAVYPAEVVRRQVALLRAAGKPVVVSMGDVAASGGYWISMNANRIYAEPGTITGSIGIFGLLLNVPDALGKLDVHNDGVGVGPMAGAFDPTRALDPQLAEWMQATIEHGYADFVGRVAKARGKSVDAIKKVAQGRVWTGKQALSRGLVDRLGGLHAAVAGAARLADLRPGYSVGYVGTRPSWVGRLMMVIGDTPLASAWSSSMPRLPTWMAPFEGREAMRQLAVFSDALDGKPAVYAYCFCDAAASGGY